MTGGSSARRARIVSRRGWAVCAPTCSQLQAAATLAAAPDAAIATVCTPLADTAELTNPNVVKTVLDRNGRALYFSRAPIPYPRDAFRTEPLALPADFVAYRHIGLYAYRCAFLHAYSKLAPAPPERFEALEQLRAGVDLGDFVTKPAGARRIGEPAGLWPRDPPIRYRAKIPTSWLELTLREGKNRQVRRMTARVGFPTLRLVRVRIGNVGLEGLAPGAWREVEAENLS